MDESSWPLGPPPDEEEISTGEEDGLRVIRGSSADWHRTSADIACGYLAELPELFLDRVREMMWVDDAPNSSPSIRYVIPSTVPDLLGRADVACQHLVSNGTGEDGVKRFRWQYTPIPPVLCQTVVSRRPKSVQWNRFEGFASGPYLLSSGEVISMQGFSPERGLWLPHIGHVTLPTTGKGMLLQRGYTTRDKGSEALARILKELSEFPWADPNLDPAVWLAYLLTLITRPSYDHAPLFLFEASRPRSGKDLLFKLAETIAHGRSAHRITLADNPEENEKRIATGLLAGHTTLIFGDVKHLGSPLLLSLITEGHNVVVRLLGTNTSIPVPKTLTLGANANNVTLNVPDLVPRTIHLRLDPPTDSPESTPHTLDQHELLTLFAEKRPLYLAALFNALRGFIHYRRSTNALFQGVSCGSFPQWAALVRDCLLYYGFTDVLKSQARLKQSVPVGEQGAMHSLFNAWFRLLRENATTSGNLIQMAAHTTLQTDGGYETTTDPDRVALSHALANLFDAKPTAKALTKKLHAQRDWTGMVGDKRVKLLRSDPINNTESFMLKILE